MKKILPYLLLFLVAFIGFYQLTISFLPNALYALVQQKMEARVGYSKNRVLHLDLPTDSSRAVVMPNPDFLYVSSFYDLKDGPLQLTGSMPDSTYWSVSFYQPNTVNWYIKNDRQYESDELNLVLVSSQSKIQAPEDAELVRAPRKKGFLLIRILVTDTEATPMKKYKDWQQSIELTPFKTSF